MMDKYIIGLDVGTTATKGVLYDQNGKEIANFCQGYPLIQDELGKAEEGPKLIFDAVQNVLYVLSQQIDGKIAAISWSSQMHSLIGLDEHFRLLTNSITWADNRASKIVNEAKKSGLAQAIYEKTGMPIHPMAPIYKLLWLKQERTDLFSQVRYWADIKSYLIYRLTQQFICDFPMAAGMGMLNSKTLTWDESILKQAGIIKEQLPKLAKPESIVAGIIPEYQQKLGLSSDTKVVLGASDGYLSTIGVNVLNNQNFALNIGTSGAIRTLHQKPLIEKQARVFCYTTGKKDFLLGAPVNNGGIVLQWAKQILLEPNTSNQDFLDLAENSPVGSNGLIFHPYLGGERAPIWNPLARGSFVGLTRQHSKSQMARSVIEGILFNLNQAMQLLMADTIEPKMIKATGGFLRSNFIRQMTADILALPVAIMKNSESGTLAAMFLGRLALGWSKQFNEIENFNHEENIYYPDEVKVKKYKQIYAAYRQIGLSLDRNYEMLNDL